MESGDNFFTLHFLVFTFFSTFAPAFRKILYHNH